MLPSLATLHPPGRAPLFGAVPGGPEMLIILLVLLLFFGPVVAIVVFGLHRLGDDGEVRELERRIDELEAKVEGGGGSAGSVQGRDATGGPSTAGRDPSAAGRDAGTAARDDEDATDRR